MKPQANIKSPAAVDFHDLHPKQGDFAAEILKGLLRPRKTISPKFFYDERGSELFSQICRLPEYYPTRAEMALLGEKGPEIAALLEKPCALIEYGCGDSEKVHLVLDKVEGCRAYVGIDICKTPLLKLAQGISRDYPRLRVVAVCADFLKPFDIPLGGFSGLERVAFFPGSSIGNLDPDDSVQFLGNVARMAGEGGWLLIGVDLKKEPQVLHAAYNDSRGVTAAFNKNVLRRVNREALGDFDLERFEHRAFYNEAAGRVEMHLESVGDQTVNVGGKPVRFKSGETIHTENSYKYAPSEFQSLALRGGWQPVHYWTDAQNRMSLHLLRVPNGVRA